MDCGVVVNGRGCGAGRGAHEIKKTGKLFCCFGFCMVLGETCVGIDLSLGRGAKTDDRGMDGWISFHGVVGAVWSDQVR